MKDLSIRQLEEEIDLLNEVCSDQAKELYRLETKLSELKNPINYRSKLDAHLYQEYKMISTESELDDIAHCVLSTLQVDCNE